jgi:hypothetical protein
MSIPKQVLETLIQNFNVKKSSIEVVLRQCRRGRLYPSRTTRTEVACDLCADQGQKPDKTLCSLPMNRSDSEEEVKERNERHCCDTRLSIA